MMHSYRHRYLHTKYCNYAAPGAYCYHALKPAHYCWICFSYINESISHILTRITP
jgi:hypothetical protein